MKHDVYIITGMFAIIMLVFLAPYVVVYGNLLILHFLLPSSSVNISFSDYFDVGIWVRLSGFEALMVLIFFVSGLTIKSPRILHFVVIITTVSSLVPVFYIMTIIFATRGNVEFLRTVITSMVSSLSTMLKLKLVSDVIIGIDVQYSRPLRLID